MKRGGLTKISYPNGDSYEGQINDAKQKHGSGKYTWVEQVEDELKEIASYEGEYVASKKHGLGKMKFPNGDTYHGMWSDDAMNGDGTFIYANGDIFSGNFTNGIKEGQGTYEFQADKSQLVGEWKAGTIVSGTWRFACGGSYTGQFEKGKPIGRGVFNMANGYQQDGEYRKTEAGGDEGEGASTLRWNGATVLKMIST